MSPLRSVQAVWPLILVALVTASEADAEKDSCSQSLELLQIGAQVHGVTDHASDCGDGLHHATTPGQSSRATTLLQVSAKTGEVAHFSQHHEEESSSSHKSEHQAITDERREHIASLLKQGGASDESPSQQAQGAHETAGQAQQGTSVGSAEAKPDAQVLQGARIAPFGKEDTARELQHHAARTQDTLVDAIENAEVAEIKRSIFRSLTRLRAAEIKEFDTIARLETQAIDEYNDNHHYRAENPLDYIHSAEVGVKEDKYTSFHD